MLQLVIWHNYTVGGTTQCYNWQYGTIIQKVVQHNTMLHLVVWHNYTEGGTTQCYIW